MFSDLFKLYIFLFILFILNFENKIQKNEISENSIKTNHKMKKYLIIYNNYSSYDLFTFYNHFLGCCLNALTMGYIPIFDLKSYSNIFNNYNRIKLKINPYEIYFYQPFNLTLKEVLKSKNYKIFNCHRHENFFPEDKVVNNENSLDFWHIISEKYMPIKIEIIKEALSIKNKLFHSSNNILGILPKGIDYLNNRTPFFM